MARGAGAVKDALQPLVDLLLTPSVAGQGILFVLNKLIEAGKVFGAQAEAERLKQEALSEVMKRQLEIRKARFDDEDAITALIVKNIRTWNTMRLALGSVTEATDILTRSEQRLLRIQRDLAEGADAFSAGLARIGTRLNAHVNAEIEKNNALLEEAQRRFELGALKGDLYGVTLEDLARIERDVNAANELLLGSLTNVTEGYEAAAPAADAAAESIRTVRQASVETTPAITALGRAVNFTSQDFDRLAESAGRAAAVTGAVAAGGTITSDGRRVHIPGGGSRLTSEPGFQSSNPASSSLPGGTFTVVQPAPAVSGTGRIEVD